MNVPGWSVRAIAPATRPPSAMPRFIVMRCCANAVWRRSFGVSDDNNVDWLGQNEPLPAPTSMLSTNACHGVRMSGNRAKPRAMITSAPERTVRGPSRSESAPPTNPEHNAAAAFAATISPAMPSEIPRTLCR